MVEIRIWTHELMTLYQWEVIETVDCQVCCRVRLKHYYSCLRFFSGIGIIQPIIWNVFWRLIVARMNR